MILPRAFASCVLATIAFASLAADFSKVDPTVYGKDDPRTKDLAKMMQTDARKRMQEANLRESKAFADVTTKEQWEEFRDYRIKHLKQSLGSFPDVPKDMKIVVTKKIEGDGFVIHNTLFETRPGFWVAANVYLPAKPPEKMPGIVIAHSHHGGKTGGELQDMGMTWARSGVAVIVPDQLGYGERRQHDFNTDKDFDKPFRVGRQDYYFRYNSNLVLSSIGDSLMGWMVWDLMRCVDVLLKQPTIDAKRIIMMGSVAGGGDPVGVTAALDNRIACVVPFNFGGWQPESSVPENPDRDTPWFGDGYWESTRGLRDGAIGGFAHYVIVGSVAPRKVIYAHEFAWSAEKDPAWPRFQKIFGFYNAKGNIVSVHGKGSVRGPGGPENTHCNHIGAVHRMGIYPALKEWFDMPIPEEYSKPRPGTELRCWTDEAKKELKPKTLGEVVAVERQELKERNLKFDPQFTWKLRLMFAELPKPKVKVTEQKPEEVPGGTLIRVVMELDNGITVPLFLITPKDAKGKLPAVVMVASGGKQGFLKERGDEISAFLKAGVSVCLVDVRGTGETRTGTSADRGSSRTSISQTNMILGQPVLGLQLRDLCTAIEWLRSREGIDGDRLAVWGDSFAKVNAKDAKVAVPHDFEQPFISEPGGANLALLACLFEEKLKAVYARGGIAPKESCTGSPYLHLPHDVVVPNWYQAWALAPELAKKRAVKYEATVDAQNRATGDKAMSPADGAKWVIEKLKEK